MDDKVTITYEELMDSSVDEILKRQAQELELRNGMQSGVSGGKDKVGLMYKSWFNLMLAGMVGAFIAWLCVEPMFDDDSTDLIKNAAAGFLLFSLVGAFGGLFIGSLEGILSRNVKRALKGGLLGMLIGFAGGIISTYFAGIVFNAVNKIGVAILGIEAYIDIENNFAAVFFVMIARCMAWCIAGMTLGLGPGIGLKSKRLALNGFLGGMIGGALGGLLFDPINYIVTGGTFSFGAESSRAIGLVIIGAAAGLMIGLVELITMDAWLFMTDGPLRGKQFIIYRNPTYIGSSTACEIYLFKDPYINPRHARIITARDGYLLEDTGSVSGTFVNGQKVNRHKLSPGDIIKIGESTLIYREKKKSKGGQ